MKNIAVIFGGKSVEHEISIISALQAIENFDLTKYKVLPVYISKNGDFYAHEDFTNIEVFKELPALYNKYNTVRIEKQDNKFYVIENKSSLFSKPVKHQVDAALTIVHGTNVEDGTLAGYLKTIGIPFAGPGILSGAIGQDKAVMKDILKANNISQLDYTWYFESQNRDEIMNDVIEKLSLPVIIKPATLGSSIGISVAKTKEELENSIEDAFLFCNKIVVEKLAVNFREMNISVLGNYSDFNLSVIEEVAMSDEILSFEDKYMSGSKSKSKSSGMASLDRIIPANISDELHVKIKDIASRTFLSLNATGVVRIDLIIMDDEVYINEINNMPGSLSFYLWDKTDLPYPQLLDKLINIAIKEYFDETKRTYSFESNVLNVSKGKKNGN